MVLNINPVENGMPLYKYLGNRFLTFLQNLVFRASFSEFHTGFRAFSRRVLECIPYENNSDGFVFDAEVVSQLFFFGMKLKEIPSPAIYSPEVSSISLLESIKYGFLTILTLLKYIFNKKGIIPFRIFQRKNIE